MKPILVLALFVLFSIPVFAQITTEPLAPDAATLAQINAMNQELKSIHAKVDGLPSKSDIDSSFIQLDQKIESVGTNSSLSQLAYFIGALILNDLMLLAGWLLLKYRLAGE